MKKILPKVLILLSVLVLVIIFNAYNLGQYLTLDYLKSQQGALASYYNENATLTIIAYFLIYILTTALSLPGATILTLAGGAVFGLGLGLVIVSFASTMGATVAFLASRYLLKDYVQSKFGDKIATINQGIEKDGPFYLFTLRLLPVFPFFAINLIMGLTPIKTFSFYWVSQLGMLLGTAIYVNAGVQLANIDSLSGILSPKLVLSFTLLGLFPLIAKKVISTIKAKKVYARFKKPAKFDYNMVVIGAGSAGLVTSYIAAIVKSKVLLIEKNKMGGDCLNTGCVPSKALIKSAKIVHYSKKATDFGLKSIQVDFDFKDVMNRVHNIIKKIEPHDSIERYTGLGVECETGAAKIISPWEIKVNGKTITAKNITIATGASPLIPPIEGLDEVDFLTSENLWELEELPKKLIVLGGGPIGIEMAQSFNRLGSETTIIQRGKTIMPREDSEVTEFMTKHLVSEGVILKTSHDAKAIKLDGDKKFLVCVNSEGVETQTEFDQILIAVGRKANVKGFGLEELGVTLRNNGTIEANEFLQTNYPNIYVCGDVTGPFQFTHTAAHQAWFTAINALFGRFKKFKVDYSVIPRCTYSDPEIATVGHTEKTAAEEKIPYEVTTYGIDDLDRAITESEDYGFVKVLTKPGTDKVLGATIVGSHAGELLIEFVTAMKHGIGLNKILGTIHSYPTMAEANKFLAGQWKQKRKPEGVLRLVEKYHNWERGS